MLNFLLTTYLSSLVD